MASLEFTPTRPSVADEVDWINTALREALALESGCPAELAEAMRYAVLGPGKRLRPRLVRLAAEACGGDPDAAMPAACAVEMIHAYSLVHDDLPAMDDDDLRRGRPTCHIQFDEATAILVGDALLALAFETAGHADPARRTSRCGVVRNSPGPPAPRTWSGDRRTTWPGRSRGPRPTTSERSMPARRAPCSWSRSDSAGSWRGATRANNYSV